MWVMTRFPEGLPWVAVYKLQNPERVAYQSLRKEIQPLQGCDFSVFSPRVARCSQPWAESFNPVGIGKISRNLPLITWYSTENSEEPDLEKATLGVQRIASKT